MLTLTVNDSNKQPERIALRESFARLYAQVRAFIEPYFILPYTIQ